MKKILCPTDFSKAATNAVEFGALIATKTGGTLTLVHVIHLPMLDTTDTALAAGELMGEHHRHATDKLHALSRHLTEKYKNQLQVNYLVQEALLNDAIEDLTQKQGYDLVVVGSTGGGNTLEEILIGSNTEAIIENVKCPVLSVPLKALIKPFQHIVYASNYQEEDTLALKETLAFAQLFNATVEIVHVSHESSSDSQSKTNQFRQRLQHALPGSDLNFHEVVHKDEVVGMKGYLTQKDADLLVIMKKRKGFFSHLFSQSFSEQLTYQSKLPMLVIHE